MQEDKAREKGMEMDEERKHRDGLRKRGEAEDRVLFPSEGKTRVAGFQKSGRGTFSTDYKSRLLGDFQSVQSTT